MNNSTNLTLDEQFDNKCSTIWFKTLSSFKNSRFCSVLVTKYKAKRQDHKKVLPLFHCIVLNFLYLRSIILNKLSAFNKFRDLP